MALRDKDLTDLSAVKDELGISGTGSDSTLERYIKQATDRFSELTGRNWHFVSEYTETVPGYGKKRLVVEDHLPIDTINSIKLDTGESSTDTVGSGSYEIENAKKGFIRRITGSWEQTTSFRAGIEPVLLGEEMELFIVDYDGGYETPNQSGTNGESLPKDVEEAIIDLVVYKFRSKGRDPSVRRERLLSAGISYASGEGSGSELFDQVVKQYTSPMIA